MAEVRIDKKIVSYAVLKDEKAPNGAHPSTAHASKGSPDGQPTQMNEKIERPLELAGSTYKIKSPLVEHAIYVTINDIVLNQGTPHEQRRPFEIFINSKDLKHYQWIVALTRIISAVFRKGGDIGFLAEELKAVFDPSGGYFRPGGKYIPSVVAEIGDVIERHLVKLGIIKERQPQNGHVNGHGNGHDDSTFDLAKASAASSQINGLNGHANGKSSSMSICGKCSQPAVVHSSGCSECLSCGHSRCF